MSNSIERKQYKKQPHDARLTAQRPRRRAGEITQGRGSPSLPADEQPACQQPNNAPEPLPDLVEMRSDNVLKIKSIEPVLVGALVVLGGLFLHYNQTAAAGFIAALLSIPLVLRLVKSCGSE